MATNAKAAGTSGGHRFIATDWKPLVKDSLRGFFTIVTPSGLKIKHAMLHERDGQRWIGLPGKPFTKADGSISYANIIDFDSRETKQRFQDAALCAVDELLKGVQPS